MEDETLTEPQAHDVNVLFRSASDMQRLVNDVLDLAKLREGSLKIREEAVGVLCRVCCVACAVSCVLCRVCCVACAVSRVLCRVCCAREVVSCAHALRMLCVGLRAWTGHCPACSSSCNGTGGCRVGVGCRVWGVWYREHVTGTP